MSKQKKVRRIEEDGTISEYATLMEAAKEVGSKSKIEDWKIAIYILNAINTGKRAYKSSWEKI